MYRYSSDKTYYNIVWILLLYFFFIDYFAVMFTSTWAGIIYVIIILLLITLSVLLTNRLKIGQFNSWSLALMVMIYCSREEIAGGSFYWVIIYILSTLLISVLCNDERWLKKVGKVIARFGNIHIFTTIILFLFSPYLYNLTLLHIWGGAPGGVGLSDAYKAGISAHYSTNGTYCTLPLIFYACSLVVRKNDTSKKNKYSSIFLLLGIFAVLLTTKRAHLLFSTSAIMVVYYISSNKNKMSRLFKILTIGITLLLILFLLSPIIPAFGAIIERFVGSEDISTGRFGYWEQAWSIFVEHKIFGIGWGQYAKVNPYGTGVHNVYIQLLCETGIVGFVIFVYTMLSTCIMSIISYRKYSSKMDIDYREIFLFSIATQIFYLLYSFTGNCLYDMNMIFYYFVCSMALCIIKAIEKENCRVMVDINE